MFTGHVGIKCYFYVVYIRAEKASSINIKPKFAP